MMSYHKSVSLDQSRARHAQDNERLSLGASLMIWVILAGFSWLGIVGILELLTA